MKFEHSTRGILDVRSIILDEHPEPLQQRECRQCGSTIFYAVRVAHVVDDTTIVEHMAMCEGCNRIVDLQ